LTQKIFYIPNNPRIYSQSAKLFFDLRRQGVTVRNTVDVMIAFTAIYNQIPLLHNDRDFDFIAEKTPSLRILG
jgi:predicted nucleic acid-binding protein